MPQRSRAQRLNGLFPLSYVGVVPVSPVNFVMDDRPPTINDSKNFYIGDLWLDISTQPPGAEDLWMLVSLVGHSATWVNFAPGAAALETLTGNSGGPVPGDPADNINVIGDGTTINIVGNPGTNTLTVSAVGTGLVSSLTGNSGGPVFPTAGNINVLGTGVITVVGNPGTSTLTVTPSGDIASSFITNPATGTATPVAGVLTFAGTGSVTVSAAGSTVTINGGTSGTVTGLLAQDGNTVTPTAGVIQVSGAEGITTTGTVGPNTLTIHPPASSCAFFAYLQTADANATGDGTTYTLGSGNALTIAFDQGGDVTTSGIFTAPASGIYSFSASVDYVAGAAGGQQVDIWFNTSAGIGNIFGTGLPTENQLANFYGPNHQIALQADAIIQMTAGETCRVQLVASLGAKTDIVDGSMVSVVTYFCGHRIA